MSWRKILLTAAAVVVVAATFAPTEASAYWRGRGWGWGWGAPAVGLGVGLGVGIARAGSYYGGYPAYGAYGYPAYGPAYSGCWRRQVFYTPNGVQRVRRVWVCG